MSLHSLKVLMRRLLPRCIWARISDLRLRYRTHRYRVKKERAFNQFVKYNGLVVLQGPFAGMRYIEDASGSELLPKLIGTYESELHSVIDEIIERRYSRIVDVGCAEGYYAVGLAYRCPWAKIEAYDIDDEARQRCHTMATLNDVASSITINKEFTVECLGDSHESSTLIVCDCEGAERSLFGDSDSSHWKHCDMLIELHDAINRGTTSAIIGNLALTHNIKLIDSRDPCPDRVPSLWFLSSRFDRQLAISEERFPMQWAWITRAR